MKRDDLWMDPHFYPDLGYHFGGLTDVYSSDGAISIDTRPVRRMPAGESVL